MKLANDVELDTNYYILLLLLFVLNQKKNWHNILLQF